MELNNSSFKFDRKFSGSEVFQVKMTSELLEDLENPMGKNEVILNIDDKSCTLAIPQNNNLSKIFNLNIEPIMKGIKESLELNIFRPSHLVEAIAPLNVRLNVQATSKVCDMTKKKNVDIENENKKHSTKDLKIPVCTNKSSSTYKVGQNKESRKIESNSAPTYKKSISPKLPEKVISKDVKKTDFTIREKILNLLALKPSGRDYLFLSLRKMGVTSTSRTEVETNLNEVAYENKDKLYQLKKNYILEVREDWPHFNEESRNKIAKMKAQIKNELGIQSNFDHKKYPVVSNKPSQRDGSQDTISPAESHSSSKTGTSTDEGFLSGDKRSPVKNYGIPSTLSFKRRSQHLSTEPPIKKTYGLSDKNSRNNINNDIHSSSSCDVTPKSDVSQSSTGFRPVVNQLKLQPPSGGTTTTTINSTTTSKSSSADQSKVRNTDVSGTQQKFNMAFEEYSRLCTKIKERELEIEKLRTKSKTAIRSDYIKLYKVAKSLLEDMESRQFQDMVSRVKSLESTLSQYVQILSNLP